MLERKPVFPNVIELNVQAGHRLGCSIYLVFDGSEWLLIDIGYEDGVDEVVELVRQMDFPLSRCKTIIASHADVDHIQGLARAKQILKTTVTSHRHAVKPLEQGDPILTFAEVPAQGIKLNLSPVKVENVVDEGDTIQVGNVQLEVWHTPGHTDSQLSLRKDGLLFSGDNIFRDGSVGAIDAHHGSNLPDFIKSLHRILASDIQWILPSHGPIFRKDDDLLKKTIARLESYQHLADFGTLAIDWPLMDQWDQELVEGKMPE